VRAACADANGGSALDCSACCASGDRSSRSGWRSACPERPGERTCMCTSPALQRSPQRGSGLLQFALAACVHRARQEFGRNPCAGRGKYSAMRVESAGEGEASRPAKPAESGWLGTRWAGREIAPLQAVAAFFRCGAGAVISSERFHRHPVARLHHTHRWAVGGSRNSAPDDEVLEVRLLLAATGLLATTPPMSIRRLLPMPHSQPAARVSSLIG